MLVQTQTIKNFISLFRFLKSSKFIFFSSSQSETKTSNHELFSLEKFFNHQFIASNKFVHCFETLFSSTQESMVKNKLESVVKGNTLCISHANTTKAYLFQGFFITKSLINFFDNTNLEYDSFSELKSTAFILFDTSKTKTTFVHFCSVQSFFKTFIQKIAIDENKKELIKNIVAINLYLSLVFL